MNEERRYPNVQAMAEALAHDLGNDLREALSSRGAAVMLVSARASLLPVYAQLREQDLDWSGVTLVLTDDAWIAPSSKDHPEHSGERLLRRTLLQGALLDASLLALWGGQRKPIEAVVGIGEALARLPRPYDAALLAPGEHGQIAGLFDQAPALDAMLKPDWAVKVAPALAPTEPRERITLTLSALLDARRVYLAQAQDIPAAPDERARSVDALLRQRRTALCVLHA